MFFTTFFFFFVEKYCHVEFKFPSDFHGLLLVIIIIIIIVFIIVIIVVVVCYVCIGGSQTLSFSFDDMPLSCAQK